MKVPAGLLVSVAHTSDPFRRWKPHTMKRSVLGRRVAGSSGAVVLQVGE